MTCLHICNDFLGSKVYSQLYEQLDQRSIVQYVFNPLRQANIKNIRESNFLTDGSKIYYSKVLHNYNRILFRSKVDFLFKNLKSTAPLNEIDIVHATTMYSDGAIALKVKKEYNVPYIVTVRSTDIAAFNTYRPDLFFLGLAILNNASKIIFISHALRETFYNHFFFKLFKKRLLPKSKVITNGLHQFWIDNLTPKKNNIPSKILYVGTFLKRKNVVQLIDSVLRLKNKKINIELSIVGKGGEHETEVKRLSDKHPDTIKYVGAIDNRENLLKEYRSNHLFAMPSMTETFGLVYLEALSQGLPILYTENDGIDGTLDVNIGEAVNPKSLNSITLGLEKILADYSNFDLNQINFSDFSWKSIGKTYEELYTAILNNN